ncbi:MAG: OmpA family protein [Rhodothermaceae bacterium]|nr:OmpA family protein [Rhodothermaceae bacterium]
MNTYRFRLAVVPLAFLLLVSLGQTGCQNMSNTARGAGIGAGAGAVVGGVIGRATGSTAKGAIIGAAVGGTAGAIIGRQMDQQAEELDEELENATVERVSDPETGAEGIAITFDNAILFDLNSSTLKSQARADLADLASSLRNYPGHDAVIVGHASADGPEDYNQSLSERRASAVSSYLQSLGIDGYRLRTVGMGESDPVASNDTEYGRQQNRRVEIAIYASEAYQQEMQNEYGG